MLHGPVGCFKNSGTEVDGLCVILLATTPPAKPAMAIEITAAQTSPGLNFGNLPLNFDVPSVMKAAANVRYMPM
jgi:hypothetical protein